MDKDPSKGDIQDGFWPESPEPPAQDRISIWNQHSHLEVDSTLVRSLISVVLKQSDWKIQTIKVIFADARYIHELNLTWKNADYETDVLAFSLGSDTEIDVEVYVNLDFAQEHCQYYGTTFQEESSRYVVHGLLHVFGYEDDTPESKRMMQKMEDECLRQLEFTGT